MDTLTKKKRQALAVIIVGSAVIASGATAAVILFMRHTAASTPTSTSTTSPIPFVVQLLGFIAMIFLAIAIIVAIFQKLRQCHGSFVDLIGRELGKLGCRGHRQWIYFSIALLVASINVHEIPKIQDSNLVAMAGDTWNVIVHGDAPTVNTPFFPDAPKAIPAVVVVPMMDWLRIKHWLLLFTLLCLTLEFGEDVLAGIRRFAEKFGKYLSDILGRIKAKSPTPPQKAVATEASSTPPLQKDQQPSTAATTTLKQESSPITLPKNLWTQIMTGEVAASAITAIAFGLGHALFHEIREARDIRKGLVQAS